MSITQSKTGVSGTGSRSRKSSSFLSSVHSEYVKEGCRLTDWRLSSCSGKGGSGGALRRCQIWRKQTFKKVSVCSHLSLEPRAWVFRAASQLSALELESTEENRNVPCGSSFVVRVTRIHIYPFKPAFSHRGFHRASQA